MIFLKRPDESTIERLILENENGAFNYDNVGSTLRSEAPSGYFVNHQRILLGSGEQDFHRARDAICRWDMFRINWVDLYPREIPLERGAPLFILANVLGIWSLTGCRIIATQESHGTTKRFGVVFGTLPYHLLSGEERLSVEWDTSDDTVWYEVYSFSKPAGLTSIIAAPMLRHLQSIFTEESSMAMQQLLAIKRPHNKKKGN